MYSRASLATALVLLLASKARRTDGSGTSPFAAARQHVGRDFASIVPQSRMAQNNAVIMSVLLLIMGVKRGGAAISGLPAWPPRGRQQGHRAWEDVCRADVSSKPVRPAASSPAGGAPRARIPRPPIEA